MGPRLDTRAEGAGPGKCTLPGNHVEFDLSKFSLKHFCFVFVFLIFFLLRLAFYESMSGFFRRRIAAKVSKPEMLQVNKSEC